MERRNEWQMTEQTDGSSSDETGRALDVETFIALLTRHQPRIRAFVLTLLPLDSDVDELVQVVSIVAWKKFHSFRYESETPDEQFVRWVCTIAKFQVLKERARRRRNREVVPFDEELINRLADYQIERVDYVESRRTALGECLRKLTPRELEIVRRRYVKNEPVAMIAEFLGRGQSAAYNTLSRLRVRLLECIERTLKREISP